MNKKTKPIVLTVLDGWGYRAETKGNAIALARKPAYDELLRKFPNTLIHTSGPYVGLPEGQMGNSEVGPYEHGRRAHRAHGHHAHRFVGCQQTIGQRALFQQAMERGRERQLHFIGLLATAGFTPTFSTSSRCWSWLSTRR